MCTRGLDFDFLISVSISCVCSSLFPSFFSSQINKHNFK
jgi:hypothetical protein